MSHLKLTSDILSKNLYFDFVVLNFDVVWVVKGLILSNYNFNICM